MTLNVDFDSFAEEVRRYIPDPVVYVQQSNRKVWATAYDPKSGILIRASMTSSLEAAKEELEGMGFHIKSGIWGAESDGETGPAREFPFIAAVAYKTSEEVPGLWVDASSEALTQAAVLKSLYDEFIESGEIGAISLEEFIRAASPNVVIITPSEVERFISEQGNCA